MANHRLIHKEAATGDRTTSLDAFEFRVWVQYQLSADDFGVCPASAAKLQGDNRWLEKQPARKVQTAIERLIAVNLVQVFADKTSRYLYQQDWQDWQRIKHTTTTSLPPIPAELLEKCCPKTRALFRENHPKIAKVLPPHAGACVAPANATATANDLSEESPRETIAPRSRGPALIASPLEFQRKHGAVHVTEFCDWVCFPNDLANDFAKRITGVLPEEAHAQVVAWARTVRAAWLGRTVPDGSCWDFWKHRWTETHGGSKPATGQGFDPLAGVKALRGSHG